MLWVALTLGFGVACTGEVDKDPADTTADDTDTTGPVDTDLSDPCADVQFVQEVDAIRLDGNVVTTATGGSEYGYVACSIEGDDTNPDWTCVGAYDETAPGVPRDLNGAGSLTCTSSQGTTTKFFGGIEGGHLGIKCQILRDETGTVVISAEQYAEGAVGEPAAGKVYALPLVTGASAVQNAASVARLTLGGVGENAYADIEFGPRTLIDGTQTDMVCIGNSNADASIGGLYCLSTAGFFGIPSGDHLVTDLESYGAVFYSHGITDDLGIPEWFPYFTLPLTGGRIAVGDSRFDSIVTGRDAGLMTVFDAATGARQFSVPGSVSGVRLGVAGAELGNGASTVLFSTAPIGKQYQISDLTPGAITTDLGTGTFPRVAVDSGMSVATVDYCDTQWVLVGAPGASKNRNSPSVGAVYIYSAEELIAAAANNSEATPSGSFFGQEGDQFGWSVIVVEGETPSETKVVVGAPGSATTITVPFESLLATP